MLYVGKIIEKKVGRIGGQSFPRPRACRDRDCARAECLSTIDVVTGIANDVDLRRQKFAFTPLLDPSQGERTKLIAIMMIIRERAQGEEVPQLIMGEF